jgi:2-(3-amino-3-carboxypropyl)histidine synthase
MCIFDCREAIDKAKDCNVFGVVLGTLGRQGSPKIFNRIRTLLRKNNKKVILFLMAELNPTKIQQISEVEVLHPLIRLLLQYYTIVVII